MEESPQAESSVSYSRTLRPQVPGIELPTFQLGDRSTLWATAAPSDALRYVGQHCQQLLAGDEWKSECLAAEAYALLYHWPILHSCLTLYLHHGCSYLWSCTVVLVVKVWILSNLFWHRNGTICQCWLEPNNSSLHRFAKDLLEAGALTWSNFSAKCNIQADFFNQPAISTAFLHRLLTEHENTAQAPEIKRVHSNTAATVGSKSLRLVGSAVFHAVLSNITRLINNKFQIRMTDSFHWGQGFLQEPDISALNKVSLTHRLPLHTYRGACTHNAFNLLWLPLSHQSILLAITVSASLCCMLLYRSECLFCFMSGFPLDPLCAPIRFVTQLLWMGLRERQRGKEEEREGRVRESEVGWSSFLEIWGENKNVSQSNRGGEREQRGKRRGKLQWVQAGGYERTAGSGLEDFWIMWCH